MLNEIDEHGEIIGNMLVKPFKTSHDSVGSLGYSIITPDEHRITVCTDTGYITEEEAYNTYGNDTMYEV